jgi:hypothetical protein
MEFEGTPFVSSSQNSEISISKDQETFSHQTDILPLGNVEDIPVNEIVETKDSPTADKEKEKSEQEGIVKAERVWSNLPSLFSELRKLYTETKMGPWTLGPIDTTKYHQVNLDLQIAKLIYELSDLQGSQKWLISQLTFFLEPVFHGMLGPMINRLVLKNVYRIISEEAVAKYLLSFRLTFWPNNQFYQPPPARSIPEKAAMRRIVKCSIENTFKRIYN